MIADSLKASLPSNLATVKENEVVEEKNPVDFDIAKKVISGYAKFTVQPERPAKSSIYCKSTGCQD